MPADKMAILLIAYGSLLPSGLAALRAFEARVRTRYPGVPVRWAYTSDHIRSRLAVEARHKSDSVVKGIRRLALERFGPIVAQPLQIISATENESVGGTARELSAELGVPVGLGTPLLATDEDVRTCAGAILTHVPAERLPDEDVLFVGHGASHTAQERYKQLSALVAEKDPRLFMTTLSGDMTLDTLIPRLTSRRLWLVPFLAGVGKHTVSDIAGDEPDSVRSLLEKEGHECLATRRGLLENDAFASVWLAHLDEAMAGFGRAPVRG